MFWLPASIGFGWLLHAWPFILGGIIALLTSAIYQIRSRQAQSWPVVDGTVESHLSRVEVLGSEQRKIAEVSYSFNINSEYYSGAYVVAGEFEFDYFPKGSRVVVHYKPSDPSISFLDREDVRFARTAGRSSR